MGLRIQAADEQRRLAPPDVRILIPVRIFGPRGNRRERHESNGKHTFHSWFALMRTVIVGGLAYLGLIMDTRRSKTLQSSELIQHPLFISLRASTVYQNGNRRH